MSLFQKLSLLGRVVFSRRAKWSLRNPGQADILIVDNDVRKRLEAALALEGKTQVLHTIEAQNSLFYVSPRIVGFVIKRVLRAFFSHGLNIRELLRPVFYYEACIDVIKPRLIIDNIHYPFLAEISAGHPEIVYFTILNSYWLNFIDKSIPEIHELHHELLFRIITQRRLKVNNFHIFCYGQRDINIFEDIGLSSSMHGIHYHAVGSLFCDFFVELKNSDAKINEFDVCFVSQLSSSLLRSDWKIGEVYERETTAAAGMLSKYVADNDLSIAIHLRSPADDDRLEKEFYLEKFKSYPKLTLCSNCNPREVYETISRSRIVVSLVSSLSYEAMSMGKRSFLLPLGFSKIIKSSCSRYLNDQEMWPWIIANAEYSEFASKFEELRLMSDDEYSKALKSTANYFFDSQNGELAHIAIRRHINRVLEASCASST
jgi:hypothetical protein